MKQKCSLEKTEAELLKAWKKEKAKEQAKDFAIDLLVGLLNSFNHYGTMSPVPRLTVPKPITREDLFPTRRNY